MACYTAISQNLALCGSARATKGLKEKAWIANNGELTFTRTDNLISSIAKVSGKRAYVVDSLKDKLNAGNDGVISETVGTGYKHMFSMVSNEKTAAARKQMDKMDNLVAIVEVNGSQTEGCFLAYGVQNGLWKSSDTQKALDNNAQRTIELSSRDGMEEEFSCYVVWAGSYAATLAILTGLETV